MDSIAFEQLSEKLSRWYDTIIINLPNIGVALIILLVFYLLSLATRNAVRRLVMRFSRHKSLSNLIVATSSILLLLIGVIIALEILNLGGAVTSLLTGAGILGFALGFAFQDIIANFISGVIIALREPFKVGDLIRTNDFFGVAETPSLRATKLRTPDGQIITIPNKDILLNPLTNFTTSKVRRVDLRVGIAYDSDLKKVESVLNKNLLKVNNRVEEREIEIFFENFSDSSITVLIRIWINFVNKQSDYFEAQSQAIQLIKVAFEKEGITIPYPTSTIISKKRK